MCKPISTHRIAPPTLSSCYVLIEELIVPNMSSYKAINHEQYMEKTIKKLELLQKEDDEENITDEMMEAEKNLLHCLPPDLKSKIM
jgi:hypothetical protein